MKENNNDTVNAALEIVRVALLTLSTADSGVKLPSSSVSASCFAFCLLLALQSGIINKNLFIVPLLMFVCSGLWFSLFKLDGTFD